ncbi:ABC transporter substrate-binding protein [Propylenella binzhouense]|uniref:ABC transporter substrate-binding protein n=1 Tax=Propylenella binzhouense TaxID=2555902 RepID=A0A964WTM5_9HYPH|nr:ABC transporter substrate-binding protein [Propylenella binzhouense]MYZ48187.1 ABC transporter substrate-binding protein [Propylenella binzhouense]
MSKKIQLTLACGDYEIVRPLKEGIVQPDGIELTVLTGMDSTTRHWRFLRNRDFDMAETSASSYIVARDNGYPINALPVFLHRRFRHGFVYINTTKGITRPTDLIGRKVGLKSFLVTAGHWMRGILEHEYGVPHRSIEWVTELDEDVDFTPPPDLRTTRLPHDRSVEAMLADGELDALIHSSLIKPLVSKDPRVARLFPDYKAEEIRYFGKTGIFPIMHVLGIKNEVLERYPWVAVNMFNAFNEAKAIAMKRMENPRIVPLAWYREAWEEQQEVLGPDPWEYGLTDRNRHALATLAGYSYEQGLIRRPMSPDDLFVPVTQGRKRGDEFRI